MAEKGYLSIDEAISKVKGTFGGLAYRTVENYNKALETFRWYCKQGSYKTLNEEFLDEYDNWVTWNSTDILNESTIVNKLKKLLRSLA